MACVPSDSWNSAAIISSGTAAAEEGDRYTQEIVEETARHLRDPLFSSVIAIIPVKSSTDGTICSSSRATSGASASTRSTRSSKER